MIQHSSNHAINYARQRKTMERIASVNAADGHLLMLFVTTCLAKATVLSILDAKLPLYAFKKINKVTGKDLALHECQEEKEEELPVAFLDSLILGEWEDRLQRGLFRYDVTACETKVIPGEYGFIAQLNEGRHLKKRPTEFQVDKVLQPFDGNKFNFTKVGEEEVLFQFEASDDGEVQFFPNAPIYFDNSPSFVAINYAQQPPQWQEVGFLEGCLAALCCCCMLDACSLKFYIIHLFQILNFTVYLMFMEKSRRYFESILHT